MTTPTTIEQGHGYTIRSYHKGLAYEVKHDATGLTVFLQGDDAVTLEHELAACARGSRPYAELLDYTLSEYFASA